MNRLARWLKRVRTSSDAAKPAGEDLRFQMTNLTRRTRIASSVEVADSGAKRSKGLLGRTGLAPGEAIWIVPCESVHTFGMKFAIDLIYLDRQLRIRKIAAIMSARFDERLAERTRLARELHDTLLQTIQGSKMVADDVLDQSADLARMRSEMERVSGWLGQAMEEGRTALRSLRASTIETNDLASSLRDATKTCLIHGSMKVEFLVTGASRQMHPIVRDEIYRIGYEAIRNASLHSKGSLLVVELVYGQDLLLRVTDNGKGIEPAIAAEGKRGHFGLQGMRERAARIGAKLNIVTSTASGTEVSLAVPGRSVFRGGHSSLQSIFERMKAHFDRDGKKAAADE